MLRISSYKKAYGPATVLQIDNLVLPPGIYWLKGENGSGKTTLFKSIAGLVPFDGAIEVSGVHIRKQRTQYTRLVSFAEAEPVYPSFLTGTELLQFYQQTKGGDKRNMLALAEAFGMNAYLQNEVATYSSGMLKKLSLVLAFTGNAKLILLDEPFVTLDVEAVDVLQHVLSEKSRNGLSFLISSHQELSLTVPCQSLRIHHHTIQEETHAAGS